MTVPTLCHKRKSCLATIRGATAYSTNNASNIPDTIKTDAFFNRKSSASSGFRRVTSKSNNPHNTANQVNAENNVAAMAPAIAVVGKWANNIGTTPKPTVVKLPHQSAAPQIAISCRWGHIYR
jgi:hypothetical protein